MLKHHGGRLEEVARSEPAPLIAPLNPDAASEDWPTFCAEGANLKDVVTPGDDEEWQWVDEGSSACPGCHKYGFASKEVRAGAGHGGGAGGELAGVRAPGRGAPPAQLTRLPVTHPPAYAPG